MDSSHLTTLELFSSLVRVVFKGATRSKTDPRLPILHKMIPVSLTLRSSALTLITLHELSLVAKTYLSLSLIWPNTRSNSIKTKDMDQVGPNLDKIRARTMSRHMSMTI